MVATESLPVTPPPPSGSPSGSNHSRSARQVPSRLDPSPRPAVNVDSLAPAASSNTNSRCLPNMNTAAQIAAHGTRRDALGGSGSRRETFPAAPEITGGGSAPPVAAAAPLSPRYVTAPRLSHVNRQLKSTFFTCLMEATVSNIWTHLKSE